MRLSPRDLNYKDESDDYLCCVIRPELISHYSNKKYYEFAAEKMKKAQEKNEEKNEENKEENSSKNQKKKDFLNTFQEIIEKDMQDRLIKFNPSLFTRAKLPESIKLEGIKNDYNF